MDPPHITEFASQRYFDKLRQLGEQEQPATATEPSTSIASSIPASPSPFILPLRGSKSHDVEPEILRPEKKERSRLFSSIRSKGKDLFHSKPLPQPQSLPQSLPPPPPLPTSPLPLPQQLIAQPPELLGIPIISEPVVPKSIPFDQRFLALPNELQLQILASLPLRDLLNLRMASKSWDALISLHEAPIVRHHLDHHIPAYANRLYPVADPSTASLHHLCGLWHRLHVSAKLSYLMCERITKEIFLRNTEAQRREFAPQKERMRRRLIPIVFTVFHFFEMYRKLHLQHIQDHDGHGLQREPYTLNPIETEIMSMYDDQTLLRVHEAFPLVISSFCRRLRPPTYVGRVERSLRGYLREKPPDEVHVAILCIGGMRQVEKIWEIKGYNTRRGAVDSWYANVAKEPIEQPSKPKRSLLGLGRKKSSFAMRDAARSRSHDAQDGVATPDINMLGTEDMSTIICSSLAAGMPMSPLSQEHNRSLLSDLPTLQHIWVMTAEALILDRKIVERAQDIKRNQQVMMDLIREDGIEEEDEWWYGRGAPDSVKPPQEAIEDDPIEGVTDA